jgi:hypothetical protein
MLFLSFVIKFIADVRKIQKFGLNMSRIMENEIVAKEADDCSHTY